MSELTRVSETEVRRELLLACRVVDALGLTEGFGHVSARTGVSSLMITPRAAPGLVHDPVDLVSYDFDEVTERVVQLLPPERHIHERIYESRTDVGAVCRFHGPYLLAVSTVLTELSPAVGFAALLGPPVAVYDDPRLIRSASAGRRFAAAVDGSGLIIRGNGAVTVGSSVKEAVVRAVWLEHAARAWVRASSIGPVASMRTEEVEAFAALPDTSMQVDRAWKYYVSQHGESPTVREEESP